MTSLNTLPAAAPMIPPAAFSPTHLATALAAA